MSLHAVTHLLALLFGTAFLGVVLLDAFQTIILPRRPAGRWRITRLFYRLTWQPWRLAARGIALPAVREQVLSIFGPLSLLLLMVCWALLLVAAYGLIFFGAGTPFHEAQPLVSSLQRLRECLYVSGTTLFTLGLGDVLPSNGFARTLLVVEAGTGLGFVALVIGYVPVLYTTFSRREVLIALLDGRAGSPPTASEWMLRHAAPGGREELRVMLVEWERWAAEVLESHVSYPVLAFYRSQHDNQSWVAALVALLDTCALLIVAVDGGNQRQAQLTFAIARHALVDLNHVFRLDPIVRSLVAQMDGARAGEMPSPVDAEVVYVDRLPPAELSQLLEKLRPAYPLCTSTDLGERLYALRKLYEPQAMALGGFLMQELPRWIPVPRAVGRTDPWTAVHNLRTTTAVLNDVRQHVAETGTQSTQS